MTTDQFTATAIALLRSAVGWQSAIARRLDVDARTVRRWLASGEIPAWVDTKLAALTGAADLSPWPRDEWLVGDTRGADGKRREYIFHMQPPRFVARVVMVDSLSQMAYPQEEPADLVSGIIYSAESDTVLCEIDWIEPVAPGEHVKWLEAAADALDES